MTCLIYRTRGRRGGFFTLREDLFKLFLHREEPKLKFVFKEPLPPSGGGKQLSQMSKLWFWIFCASRTKPSFLLRAKSASSGRAGSSRHLLDGQLWGGGWGATRHIGPMMPFPPYSRPHH